MTIRLRYLGERAEAYRVEGSGIFPRGIFNIRLLWRRQNRLSHARHSARPAMPRARPRAPALPHFRNLQERLLPPFLDDFRKGGIVHAVGHAAQVLGLRNDHSHDLEVVGGPCLSTLANRLDAMLKPIMV
jgi:hypothetical protein